MANEKTGWKGRATRALLAITISLAAANLRGQETNRKLLANPPPTYPEIARRMHLSGTVKVQVVIGPEGKIKDVKVFGGHPLLVDVVQEALKNWKYAPASGETVTILQFNFHE